MAAWLVLSSGERSGEGDATLVEISPCIYLVCLHRAENTGLTVPLLPRYSYHSEGVLDWMSQICTFNFDESGGDSCSTPVVLW